GSAVQLGFLAQDVLRVFPELVHQQGDGGAYMAVNYPGFAPILVDAVNEQSRRIEDLQADVAALKLVVGAQRE
ncbi:unnamed protein product, partial [Phaeothamnion confervicola]